MLRYVLIPVVILALAACESGPGTAPDAPKLDSPRVDQPTTPPAATERVDTFEAYRFLNQATFGATESEVERLSRTGIDAWIDDQLAQPVSLQLPYLKSLERPPAPGKLQPDRIAIWFRNAVHGPDQLRQRVAFALSQILVVSQAGALSNAPYALASYYDLLATHAFGNFRELLEAVTLHPAMGIYLSMLGNRKADTTANIRPDENFARELLQLFTIGLVELEVDGTPRLDESGAPLPTYAQSDVEEFAKIYTGWNYAGATDFLTAKRNDRNQTTPMKLYQTYHDTGPKELFGGVYLSGNSSGLDELSTALDVIFWHPNVGPFLAHRLIQRLVTSNPSPEYIERVARTFNDNGVGVRGDLSAVVRAILLDPEARPDAPSETSGKVKEPLLRITQFWRAYQARSETGAFRINNQFRQIGQLPLQAPSVFNFFSPSYVPPGELRARGLVAPELEIATAYQTAALTNLFFTQIFEQDASSTTANGRDILIDISEEVSLANRPDALVERIAQKLLGGRMPAALRQEILGFLESTSVDDPEQRAAEAVYLVAISPEFAVQY